MLETLLYAWLLVCLGVFVTRPSAMILGILGVPALWVGRRFSHRRGVFRISLVTVVVAELYVILAFALLLTTWAKWLLAQHPALYATPLLMVSLFAAILPSTLIWLSTVPAPGDGDGEQSPGPLSTIAGTAKLAPFCVIALAFLSPSMWVRLWPWVNLDSPSRSMEVVLLFSGLVWTWHLSRILYPRSRRLFAPVSAELVSDERKEEGLPIRVSRRCCPPTEKT